MRKSSPKKAAVLPFGIKNKLKTELPALVALTAIGEPWFSEQHRMDLLAVALVVAELAPAGSLEAECAQRLQLLCSGEIVREDKTAIALNLAECLPWLQLQQNHHVERAIRTLAARSAKAALLPAGMPARALDSAPSRQRRLLADVETAMIDPLADVLDGDFDDAPCLQLPAARRGAGDTLQRHVA